MSELIKVLKQVKNGTSVFESPEDTPHSIRGFQITAKALAHANEDGLLEQCEFSKDSIDGDLFYNGVYVIGGLSYKGEEFLRQETTFKGRLGKYLPSIAQWFFGILAGVVLAALAKWLIPGAGT